MLRLLAIVFLTIMLCVQGANIRELRSEMVYEVCNQSRISAEITEQDCARLQDKWNREFLCKVRGTDPKTFCWVEVK